MALPSTASSQPQSAYIFDFDITDGGTSDGEALAFTDVVLHVGGTASAEELGKIRWLLAGANILNADGVYSSADNTVTFSGLSGSVADGGTANVRVRAFFSDNTGLTDGATIQLSIDGDTDITVASGSTTFGATDPVTNGTGTEITVDATKLTLSAEPSASVSGTAFSTQPVVIAQDAAGNTDTDFVSTVALSTSGSGSLTGTTSLAATAGVATFTDVAYSASADGESFTLTASGGSLTEATSGSLTSDVVATKLIFATQPAPLTIDGDTDVTFTTAPVVKAVDAAGVVDTDYADSVSIRESNYKATFSFGGSSVNAATAQAVAGVASFDGLGIKYVSPNKVTEQFTLSASAGPMSTLTTANSATLTALMAPAVSYVTASTDDGSYKAGDTVSIQVTFDQAVDVTGTPQLTLETGATDRTLSYGSGSGTPTLIFTYTVQEGDNNADLDYASTSALSLNGGTIKSVSSSKDANLTLPTPGATNSLGSNKAIVIDTTAPSGYTLALDQAAINSTNASNLSLTWSGWEVGASNYLTLTFAGDGTSVGPQEGEVTEASGTMTDFDLSNYADGLVTASLYLVDPAGNRGTPITISAIKDTVSPSAVITGTALTNAAYTATITFKEGETAVALADGSFIVDDITVANATLSDFTNTADGTYTVLVTPTGTDTVTLDVAAGVATDVAGNPNTVATQVSTAVDTSSPSVTLTSNAGSPHSGVFLVTATFSEDVTGFELADVTVGNGTASDFQATSATVYTFTVTPTADGEVTVDVAANVATDTATNGNSAATELSVNSDSTAPTLVITGPTDVVTDDFTVTFTFSEVVTGFDANDVTVTNGTKGTFTEVTAGTVYTLVITPELGTTVSIAVGADVAQDSASNGNTAATTFTVSAGSPASEFAAHEAEIKEVLVAEATRSTVATVAANRRLAQDARNRFIASLRQSQDGIVGRNDVAFDVDGTAIANDGVMSTQGTFFQQTGNDEGTARRLFFGDFDVQHDRSTGSTTATLSGKMAWERMISEATMVGYFVGLDLGRSTLEGTFDGSQNSAGLQLGTYAVSELQPNLYFDGFLSAGVGKNNLDMTNGVLDLESSYTSQTLTMGAALSGVIEQAGYELWPELAFTLGHTRLGNVDFTGRAYGLVDNTLSLDAGDVTVANLTFRPEVRLPTDGLPVAESRSIVSFAPRLLCESVRTTTTVQDCGFGSEFGFSGRSPDGLTNTNARVIIDKIGDATRTGLQLNLEHRF